MNANTPTMMPMMRGEMAMAGALGLLAPPGGGFRRGAGRAVDGAAACLPIWLERVEPVDEVAPDERIGVASSKFGRAFTPRAGTARRIGLLVGETGCVSTDLSRRTGRVGEVSDVDTAESAAGDVGSEVAGSGADVDVGDVSAGAEALASGAGSLAAGLASVKLAGWKGRKPPVCGLRGLIGVGFWVVLGSRAAGKALPLGLLGVSAAPQIGHSMSSGAMWALQTGQRGEPFCDEMRSIFIRAFPLLSSLSPYYNRSGKFSVISVFWQKNCRTVGAIPKCGRAFVTQQNKLIANGKPGFISELGAHHHPSGRSCQTCKQTWVRAGHRHHSEQFCQPGKLPLGQEVHRHQLTRFGTRQPRPQTRHWQPSLA